MRRLSGFLLFLICTFAGWWLSGSGHPREVFRSVCDLVDDHYYKVDDRLQQWLRECHSKASALPSWASQAQIISNLQDHMNEMNVSHFQIYSPAEDRKLWKGETIDTGIRSRYVEDHLIVYRVFADSAAEDAGIRVGDEIVSLPGSDQVTPYGAQSRAGMFTLKRIGEIFYAELKPKALVIDSKPQLFDLGHGHGRLEISSFRSEYFGSESWKELAQQFSKFQHLIIDIRENAGGNFVAMLRALSTFTCSPRLMGRLIQPRKALPDKESFDDDTSDQHQISELESNKSIGLKTFSSYGCYRGKVTVLVSAETASVAEIFAHSFKSRTGSRVWGQPTAGDVILAVWYDLPALGEGFSISIPEALYLTPDNVELESKGVDPSRELFYELAPSLHGKDSWLLQALRVDGFVK